MIKTKYQCRDCCNVGEIPHKFYYIQTWVCKRDAKIHLCDNYDCEIG